MKAKRFYSVVGGAIRVVDRPGLFRPGGYGTVQLVTERAGRDPLVHVQWPDLVMGSTYRAEDLLVYQYGNRSYQDWIPAWR